MPATTRVLHLGVHPFLWLIEKVLERAPNLRVLQIIPSMERKLSARHRALLESRGVAIRVGAVKPEATGQRIGWNNRAYLVQKRFMNTLSGAQREAFDELVQFGFEPVLATVRFYGLDVGRSYHIPQHEIAAEFGLNRAAGNVLISRWIGAVLHYLDPATVVGDRSKCMARAMAAHVSRFRKLVSDTAAMNAYLMTLRIPALPPGLPLSRLSVFEAVLAAMRDGRFEVLRRADPRTAYIIEMRYGLTDVGCSAFQHLHQVGDTLGLTRERIRQLEAKGLFAMGVVDDDEVGGDCEPALAHENEGPGSIGGLGLAERRSEDGRHST